MTTFYFKELAADTGSLSEEESRHCFQVLRHEVGDSILILDGIGGKHYATLAAVSKRACQFEVQRVERAEAKGFYMHLAIAPTKSVDRMEWLVEKLVEIGVDEISILETAHSERRKLRMDRLEKKAISAMKQSGNAFVPQLNELQSLESFLEQTDAEAKLIAHVDDSHQYMGEIELANQKACLLVGPEGDFSNDEVAAAKSAGFAPVSLGTNTLRTETAGFVACCLVNLKNRF